MGGGPLARLPESLAVSVVIPARAAADTLSQAVDSALKQSLPVNDVVIAAAPTDPETWAEARRLAELHSAVRVVDNPEGNTSAGLNRAVAAAHGEVVVRLDAHAVLPPGYVAIAVEALRRPGVANVGGRQVPTQQAGFAGAVADAMRSRFGSGGAAYRGGTRSGAAETVYLGVFRREALEAVGGFDERMRRNQDYELNHRLRAAGYVVWFEPKLAVGYRPRGTVRALAGQYFQYGRWRRVTWRLHPDSLRPRQVAPPLLVIAIGGAGLLSLSMRTALPVAAALGVYGVTTLVAARLAAGSAGRTPVTALALAVMHVAWGTGFLVGPPGGAPQRRTQRVLGRSEDV